MGVGGGVVCIGDAKCSGLILSSCEYIKQSFMNLSLLKIYCHFTPFANTRREPDREGRSNPNIRSLLKGILQ